MWSADDHILYMYMYVIVRLNINNALIQVHNISYM